MLQQLLRLSVKIGMLHYETHAKASKELLEPKRFSDCLSCSHVPLLLVWKLRLLQGHREQQQHKPFCDARSPNSTGCHFQTQTAKVHVKWNLFTWMYVDPVSHARRRNKVPGNLHR